MENTALKTLHLNIGDAKKWDRAQKSQYQQRTIRQNASLAGSMGAKQLFDNAGISPDEAYREMEDKTIAILNPAGEFSTLSRLNAVSKAVGLGKLDYTYRQASAQTGGKISLSGQTGIITDAVEYKNAGTVIPIEDHGVKRDWREMLSFGADGFDTMVDDNREATLVVTQVTNDYLWDGNAKIVSPDGRVWLGIKNDTSLVQTTTSVDMAAAATTAKAIVDEVVAKRDLLRITNNCSQMIEIGISREMMSKWEQTPFSVNDMGFGTVLSYIRGLNGVASVYEDPKLSGGKEMLMAYINIDGLHAVTGQALSSYMKQRFDHNDPYTMVKWMAQGFVSKNTFSGQKCALYCQSA
jgi:hypothetical protein